MRPGFCSNCREPLASDDYAYAPAVSLTGEELCEECAEEAHERFLAWRREARILKELERRGAELEREEVTK